MADGVADFTLVSAFLSIFVFLLVFVIVYGFLTLRKPFGDGKEGLYGLLAIAFALISAASEPISALIAFLAPWFFIMIFVGFFILFVLMMFGLDNDDLDAGATSSGLRTTTITISVVLLIFGLSTIFGQGLLDAGGTNNDTETVTVVEPTNTGNEVEVTDLESTQSTATDDFGTNVLNTIRNPKVIGMIVLMLIASFAAFFLTGAPID